MEGATRGTQFATHLLVKSALHYTLSRHAATMGGPPNTVISLCYYYIVTVCLDIIYEDNDIDFTFEMYLPKPQWQNI